MKQTVLALLLLLSIQQIFSQKLITITTDQTTNLLFPSPVVHADRGTKDILVQIIKESDRVILVKAASRNFHPTSLSVVTADGNLYSFLVRYDSFPSSLIYTIVPDKKDGIEQYCSSVLNRTSRLHGVKDQSWGMQGRVNGIYIKDSVLFFRLILENKSSIPYDVDQLRFYIEDKRKAKRTTVQEIEMIPLCKTGAIRRIPGDAEIKLVFGFGKFTIPEGKLFVVEVTERDGGRNLKMIINNAKLMKAVLLNDLIN